MMMMTMAMNEDNLLSSSMFSFEATTRRLMLMIMYDDDYNGNEQ